MSRFPDDARARLLPSLKINSPFQLSTSFALPIVASQSECVEP
jgi:hypothetical protein